MLGLCVALSVGAFVLGFALWADPCDQNRLAFDHAAWIAQQDQSAMLNDLTQNVLRVGDSREAVLDILGPPTYAEPDCLRYDTGCDRWLVVRFDDKGLMTETVVHPY